MLASKHSGTKLRIAGQMTKINKPGPGTFPTWLFSCLLPKRPESLYVLRCKNLVGFVHHNFFVLVQEARDSLDGKRR